jgi:hypothetical protein
MASFSIKGKFQAVTLTDTLDSPVDFKQVNNTNSQGYGYCDNNQGNIPIRAKVKTATGSLVQFAMNEAVGATGGVTYPLCAAGEEFTFVMNQGVDILHIKGAIGDIIEFYW